MHFLHFHLNFFCCFVVETPTNWKQILQSLHLSSNIDFYHKFYQPLMQDRIKTIITTSWQTAIEQTEKNILEIFESNALSLSGNIHFFLSSFIAPNINSIYQRYLQMKNRFGTRKVKIIQKV